MRLPIFIMLLSLLPMSAFAQAADTAAGAPPDSAVESPSSTPPPAAASSSGDSGGSRRWKLGVGVHYMETVGDIKDAEGFDTGALNALLAAKIGLGLLAIELDSEWSFDFGGSDKTLWMPQALGLVDLGLIYGGLGIGGGYLDGEWFDNPLYTLRAGVKLPLGAMAVDVNANYQFMSTKALESADSEDLDSVTFGATLWF
jgi:hypothetical protein